MDFFTRFTREKTPQNNFSSQNFSVENNYLYGPVRFFKVKKKISAALAESKNCFYFVQINDSNDEEENSSIIFFFVIS